MKSSERKFVMEVPEEGPKILGDVILEFPGYAYLLRIYLVAGVELVNLV